MTAQDKLAQRPPREPQALSTEYHKARKQLMLWAGILFIWELVGIDLEKAKETGGNAGAIITAIKSPQAIPWVLLVLVAYFLFKVWIEWNQCHLARRQTLASRLDFGSAWVVAFMAGILYVYQAISRIQVADVVQQSSRLPSVSVGFVAGMHFGLITAGSDLRRFKSFSKYKKLNLITYPCMVAFFAVGGARFGFADPKIVALGAALGIPLGVFASVFLKKWFRGSLDAKLEERFITK